MWPAQGKSADPSEFGGLEVDEVLFESDSPKLFIAHSDERAFLVYESTFDRAKELVRFLAVCADNTLLSNLIEGRIPVLEALDQRTVWAIDQRFDGQITSAVTLAEGINSVPNGYKPEPGVRLRPDHHYA